MQSCYLEIFMVRLRIFKCLLEHAKKSFYLAAYAVLFAKLVRVASVEATLQFIKSKMFTSITIWP